MQFKAADNTCSDPPQYEDSPSHLPSAFDPAKPLFFADDDEQGKSSRLVKRAPSVAAALRPRSSYVKPERYDMHPYEEYGVSVLM